MPKLGDPIRLNLQLYDGATNKYVRAYLTDQAGNALAGSPVNLTHISNGLYKDSSINMPNALEVVAQYKVFDNAGYSVASAQHADAIDTFLLEIVESNSGVVVQGIVSQSPTIQGIVTQNTITGKVLEC